MSNSTITISKSQYDAIADCNDVVTETDGIQSYDAVIDADGNDLARATNKGGAIQYVRIMSKSAPIVTRRAYYDLALSMPLDWLVQCEIEPSEHMLQRHVSLVRLAIRHKRNAGGLN